MRKDVAHDGMAMTYDQIAARLGISRQGVKKIERRALRKLRNSATVQFVRAETARRNHEEAVVDSAVNLRFAKSQRSE